MSSVIGQLNQLQADAHALYVKIHNYHWNIKGIQFYPIHNKTEEIYDKLGEMYDDLAERAIQLGGNAVLTIGDIVSLTKIKEEKGDSFDAKYVLENIIKDFQYLKGQFQELANAADEVNDSTTVAMAEDEVAYFEKELWMLGASLA
ncbi:MAG: DNA starvation/stationary phase protection protein [Sulfurospirillaceae bacterium]|nr:DNA starvation/stationary phase protection protein [Sulfurospirillaceae bacterium]MCK9545452.1 DNA starvation/stationary phase protection protein [Sulfurospirillaceae bacterium]MDY0238304.1 DNA starvation/stationary phase protection protein [Campylobacterales bacterium]